LTKCYLNYSLYQGADVLIFKIKMRQKLTKMFIVPLLFCKNWITNVFVFFQKNVNFFADNWRKAHKIVIVT
jgi:hypothetical protein